MAATQSPAQSVGKRTADEIRHDQQAEAARRRDRVRWTYAQKRAARAAVAA